ncbi:MAG: AAA family ATPase [Nitrospirae bacterium]|nr:AAA family ATPase [Nitrospirota bacterium]
MYETFYGLKRKPFTRTPDPRFLFYSKAHEEALARLQHGVEEKDMMLLTGDVGCGKTTLSRALMNSLNEQYRIISIVNPRLTPSQFLRTIARRLDIESSQVFKNDVIEAIYEKVYDDYKRGITPVIIIDEAHLIPYKETFEEIRLLTNFQLDESNLLSLILIGQPDLRKRLEQRSYLSLRQRISLRYNLGPLNAEEVKEYLSHRLRIAGRTDPVFTDAAIAAIYRHSRGIPRNINNIASYSLLVGFEKEMQLIPVEIIYDISHEMGLNGAVNGYS